MTKTSDPDDAQISEEENVDLDFHEEFKPIEINVDQAQSKPNIIMPLEHWQDRTELITKYNHEDFSSSVDESEQKRQVSVSDISDAELPATASIGKDSSDNLEELEKIQVLECKICKASVSSNYEKHYKSCQSVQHYVTSNPITCILCDLTFDSTQEVFRHVKQDHGLDEFGDDEGRNFFIHIFF